MFGPVSYKFEVGDHVLEGKLEEDEQELCIPLVPSVQQAKLTLAGDVVHEFAIGGMGPVSEEKGAHARLVNLGFANDFVAGGPSGETAPTSEPDPLKTAIAAFQALHGLCRTAELDEPTAEAIRAKYEG